MKQDEHREQAALMQWWALESRYYGIDERLMYAIQNGARMKREQACWTFFWPNPLAVPMACMER